MTVTAPSGTAGFVNWFRGNPNDGTYSSHPGDSRQFMGEVFVDKGKSTSFTCDSGAYWNNQCYYDFYNCPPPCYSDSECGSNKFCDKSIVGQEIPNAGVCKSTELPTYKTKVYSCANGVRTLVKEVSSGDLNFCSWSSDYNNYLLPGGEASGVCYTLANQPEICTGIPEPPIGDNPVGQACSTDTECTTMHCDKSHWYSLSQTCQPTPWTEVIKVAATKEEISKMTVADAVNIACLQSSECKSGYNNSIATCIPINKLKEDGTLSFSSDSFMSQAKSFVQKGAIGAGVGGFTGILICIAAAGTEGLAATVTAGVALAASPAVAVICSAAITGGVVVGGTLATTVSFSDKDPITAKIKAGDTDSVGLCVAEEKVAFNLNATVFSLGTFNVTWLYLIIGIVLLIFLISMMGGRR
jgi:hypothetical protein